MAKNNEAKKYYLSPAAIARLRAESARSAYPMSVIIDMLILTHLPPVETEFRVMPLPVEYSEDAAVALKAMNKVTQDIRDAMRLPSPYEQAARRAEARADAENREATRHQEAPVVPSKERFKIDL